LRVDSASTVEARSASAAASLPVADRPRAGQGRDSRWSLVITLILAGVLLFFALRGIQWHEVLRSLRQARLALLLLTFLIFTGSHLLRSLRWYLLLRADQPLSWPPVFWTLEVGYLGNNLLPARLGELIRSAVIAARTRIGFGYALATTLAERISDSIALVSISLVASLTLTGTPDWLRAATRGLAIIAILGLICLFAAPYLQAIPRWIIGRVPLPSGIKMRLIGLLEQFLLGVQALQNPRRALSFAALTLIIWLADSIGAVIAARALGLSLTLPQALLLLAALGLASAAPSTPGYVGIYQFVAVSVLAPFGFAREQAVVFILTFQFMIYILTIVWGSLGLWRLNLTREFFSRRALLTVQTRE
jgi:uncharacterized protein (TIRG00374 family)